jgi:hypothetical protein
VGRPPGARPVVGGAWAGRVGRAWVAACGGGSAPGLGGAGLGSLRAVLSGGGVWCGLNGRWSGVRGSGSAPRSPRTAHAPRPARTRAPARAPAPARPARRAPSRAWAYRHRPLKPHEPETRAQARVAHTPRRARCDLEADGCGARPDHPGVSTRPGITVTNRHTRATMARTRLPWCGRRGVSGLATLTAAERGRTAALVRVSSRSPPIAACSRRRRSRRGGPGVSRSCGAGGAGRLVLGPWWVVRVTAGSGGRAWVAACGGGSAPGLGGDSAGSLRAVCLAATCGVV